MYFQVGLAGELEKEGRQLQTHGMRGARGPAHPGPAPEPGGRAQAPGVLPLAVSRTSTVPSCNWALVY